MACRVCGAECGTFLLCFKCNKLKEEGKIIKCEKCGRYHYADQPCAAQSAPKAVEKQAHVKATEKTPTTGKCVICGHDAPKGALCYDCYKRKESEKAELGHRRTKQEALDHYFNQRNCLYKVQDQSFVENGAIRLYAIAEEVAEYGDRYAVNRVASDIQALMEWRNKRNAPAPKSTANDQAAPETAEAVPFTRSFDDMDYRKQWTAEHQCDDGHYVRSYSEMLIDNWLYHNGYRHAYEKSVFMASDPDAVVLSDFYLPDGNVYIEFWGLNDDQHYLERKKKKQAMYAENHLNLIDLEEADVKRLNDIMPKKLFQYIKN